MHLFFIHLQNTKKGDTTLTTQNIYPGTARENYNCGTYAQIAINNYYEAKKLYTTIINDNYDISDFEFQCQMERNIIITCVFAAMSIESFLNNYASACLGDDEFYDNFDKLSVISKFQLVVKFLLKKDIDKGKAFFSNLKSLIKQRDTFVHNKSRQFILQKYISEVDEFNELYEFQTVKETPTLDKKEIKEEMMIAQTAIKAMRDFAHFFDSSDASSHALALFFKKYNPEEIREVYYNEVIKEFHI